MPRTQYAKFTRKSRRLLWLLIGALTLIGALSILVSSVLPGALENWLRQQGLEAEVDRLHISLPRLSVQVNGVRARNEHGRGFHARHLLLQFSWRNLLRGRAHVKHLEIDGAHIDIYVVAIGEERRWEVGGWELGDGPVQDRKFDGALQRARIRDSRLCFQHLPQWTSPDCFGFSELRLDDFSIALQRRAEEPLRLVLDARDLRLRNLLGEVVGADTPHTALVDLRLDNGRYSLREHRIETGEINLRQFASCMPARWAEAFPVLGSLVGHCGAARSLRLTGGANEPVVIAFGAGAQVHWRRADGQAVTLRYANRDLPNWRAHAVAISDFRYSRSENHLSWQSADASDFDWCPPPWRNREHHYCLRAGVLRLPRQTQFDWREQLAISTPEGRLQQTRLLDLMSANPNPATVNDARIGALSYRAADRGLELASLSLDSAAGCIPGQLWQQQDYCVQLRNLSLPEPLQVAFPWAQVRQPLGFASGAVQLEEFRLFRAGEQEFQLHDLQWREANFLRVDTPFLLQDFSLQKMTGCVPQVLLPDQLHPLCVRVENLAGRGNFSLDTGDAGYVVLGELELETLQLAETLAFRNGLQLQQLASGRGYLRLDNMDPLPVELAAIGIEAEMFPAWDEIDEKSLLPTEREAAARARAPPGPAIRSPNLHLQSVSLSRLEGCLPRPWMRLLYGARESMPGCFTVRNLRQRQPLLARWQQGLAFSAGELTLEQALVQTSAGEPLLHIEQLRVPVADLRYAPPYRDMHIEMPGFTLGELFGCLPEELLGGRALPRCVSARNLHSTLASSGTSLVLHDLELKNAPLAAPLLSAAALSIERVEVSQTTAQTGEGVSWLHVRGLAVSELSGCGFLQLLPRDAREQAQAAGLPDCLNIASVRLPNDNRIPLSGQALELGHLQTSAIQLMPAPGAPASISVQRLQWRGLRWAGGTSVQVNELMAQDLHACLAPEFVAARSAAWREQGAMPEGEFPHCVQMQEVHLRGEQTLALARPYSSNGQIELIGVTFRGEEQSLMGFAGALLDRVTLDGDGMALAGGHLSGLQGCLPRLPQLPFLACYRLGRIQISDANRFAFNGAEAISLYGISIEGVELVRADQRERVDARLLHADTLNLASATLARREVNLRNLRLQGITGCIPAGVFRDIDHCFEMDDLALSGNFYRDREALDLEELQLTGLQVQARSGETQVLATSARLQQLRLGQMQLDLLYLELEEGKFFARGEQDPEFERHPWHVEIGLLRVNQLNFRRGPGELEIASVDITRPQVILMRDSDGEFPLAARLNALVGGNELRLDNLRRATTWRQREQAGFPLPYRIGELYVDTGRLTWLDWAHEYEANLPVRRINLLMRNMSSHRIDPPALLLMNARPGGLGELHLSGEIDYKDTRKWDADLFGYLMDANLIPAAPYIANLLGYRILQGQLDALMHIHVMDNVVDANADMVLNKVKLRRVRDWRQLDVSRTLIPLNVALYLLKDGEGNVSFNMPVRGDLYDPEFNFSFVFSHVLQRAIMEALFSYFTPVGFFSLVRLAWERFRTVRFAPIPFPPGSAEMDAEGEAKLEALVAKLKKNPGARPGICGVSTARDWSTLHPGATPGMNGSRESREAFYRYPPDAIRTQLDRLARQRSWRVQRYLLGAGFTAGDFIQCAPDYNGRDFGQPRVELSN